MKKKILSFLALATMFFTLVPMTVFAEFTSVTVNALTTDDTTPALTGTVNDGTATISVLIKQNDVAIGNPYTATNNGTTWTLADNTITPALAVGTYVVEVTATVGETVKTGNGQLVISAPLTINTFTLNSSNDASYSWGCDPDSNDDDEEYLTINYALNIAPSSLSVDIEDENDNEVKSFNASNANLQTGEFVWDGKSSGNFVEPGTYEVIISASKTGLQTVTSTKNVVVSYTNSDKPSISSFSVDPSSFNPGTEDAIIEFTNDEEADLTVEIRNSQGETERKFSNYEDDTYDADSEHSVVWNGEDDSEERVDNDTYEVVIIARNDYGVDVEKEDVTVSGSSDSGSSSNSHISGIDLDPSSSFEPGVDDELVIEFDVKQDLDELQVYAVRGSESIELFDESDVEEENNVEVTWDGMTDDDEYADEGTWKIQFKSKVGSTNLVAADTIDVEYDKPTISDFFVSNPKFDNDLGEHTYAIFRINKDAMIDLYEMEGSSEEDTIEEEMEVEEDQWYAVEWDGGSYDYDDDVGLKLKAMNRSNEDIYNTKTVNVDLTENKDTSSKSRISNYDIDPVITDGNSEMEIYYELEDPADVTVTIHKGKSTSGTTMIELVDDQEQDSGDHTINWNGRDDDGDKLAKGFYTLKIVSKDSSTDTKYIYFVVGEVGDVSGSSSSSSSSGSSSSKINPNVTVDGGSSSSTGSKCAGFTDVSASSSYCSAITWVKSEGIFTGYNDGTFRPNQAINRGEALKVVFEALNVTVPNSVSGNLGFSDVITGEWYMPYIKVAKDKGIFNGDSGKTTARPEASVNRVEMLKFIFEGLKSVKSYSFNASCSLVSGYTDLDGGAWYYKYVCESNKYSLFAPLNNFTFDKGAYGTRGEVASALYKLHQAGLL